MEENKPLPIDWEKYGFEEDAHEKGLYHRSGFPLELREQNGFLTVETLLSEVSRDKIPATNQAVVLLLKAFNCPKLP